MHLFRHGRIIQALFSELKVKKVTLRSLYLLMTLDKISKSSSVSLNTHTHTLTNFSWEK